MVLHHHGQAYPRTAGPRLFSLLEVISGPTPSAGPKPQAPSHATLIGRLTGCKDATDIHYASHFTTMPEPCSNYYTKRVELPRNAEFWPILVELEMSPSARVGKSAYTQTDGWATKLIRPS